MRVSPVVFAALAVLTAGCQFLDPTSNTPDLDAGIDFDVPTVGLPDGAYIGPNGRPAFGSRIGEECSSTPGCRLGLECTDGACEPAGTTPEGNGCVVSGECTDGQSCQPPLACLATGSPVECGISACLPSADLPENAACVDVGSCASGLRCNLIGFTGVCQPEGTGDVGQTCVGHEDCIDPLLCAPPNQLRGGTDFTCQIPAAVATDVFMPAAECADLNPDEPFQVYFDVPGDEPLDEFYRLPFPNDARLSADGIDMRGHHNPGFAFIGGAFVDAYLEAVSRMDGFSPNPAIFLRFSQNVDFATIVAGGETPTLRFVNIDPDSPGYGNDLGFRWSITTGRGKFICPRYMAIHTGWTNPLDHGTTYAVLLSNGIRSSDGDLPTVPNDFAAMVSANAPSDARLQDAWGSYAVLRDYLTDQGLSADALVGGTVFTTQDPDAEIPGLRAAARAEAAPTLSSITRCGAGVTGPCDDGEVGACVNADGVVEVHATYQAPIWQRGTRPYLTSDDGGDIVYANGLAQVQGTETMCVSFSIPPGEMPAEGWPVAMFGHGTGGSFTSHISGGTAARLASIDLGDGDPVRMVSVGIDGSQHGPRRGGSELSEDTLFYNFINPLAAVGNVQQGAADYFTLTWMLENLDVNIDGVGPLRFDTENLYYFGHSQGATVGGLFAPFETNLRAAVFSGAGGSLVLSLLNKTNPVDIAAGVQFVLTDGGTTGGTIGDDDPLLNLLQTVIDPADPLNYAAGLFQKVDEDTRGLSVFQSYGTGDTYSPEPNQEAYARAAGLPIPTGAERGLTGYRSTEYPVSGNFNVNETPVTAVLIPSVPTDYDGHFVIFRDANLAAQSMEFLGTSVRNGVPTVSAP